VISRRNVLEYDAQYERLPRIYPDCSTWLEYNRGRTRLEVLGREMVDARRTLAL
jgi:hypothetical protein